MSPSEHDLRAALRHGEHEATQDLDVDRLVTAGRDRARQRRVRLLSGAAAVLVVAAAGTGSALLRGGSSDGPIAVKAPESAGGTGGTHSGSVPAGAATCPATLPARVPRGGAQPPGGLTPLGGTGSRTSAASRGKLFAEPVDHFLVCAYSESTAAKPIGLTVSGPTADALRTSLDDAATTRPATACPTIVRADERQLAIIGITAGGKRLPVVTATINAVPCRVVVTNGTATRYGWTPPQGPVAEAFTHLAPERWPAPGSAGPGGTAHGSPIHS